MRRMSAPKPRSRCSPRRLRRPLRLESPRARSRPKTPRCKSATQQARTSEMLCVCFFEKGACGVAESILRRGLDLPASGDQARLGILYWLGRALEQQGKKADARDLYGRVFAVDIRFLDAEQRVKALAKAK